MAVRLLDLAACTHPELTVFAFDMSLDELVVEVMLGTDTADEGAIVRDEGALVFAVVGVGRTEVDVAAWLQALIDVEP